MNVSPASIVTNVLTSIDRYKYNNKLTSILDIGAGRGIYGYYIRSFYDRFDKPKLQLDCLEPEPPDILYDIYSNVIKEKIEDYVDKMKYYDIILFVHVMEHLPKDIALEVLSKIRKKADLVIFAVPAYAKSLKPESNNIHHHKSFFNNEYIKGLGGEEVKVYPRCKVYEFGKEKK